MTRFWSSLFLFSNQSDRSPLRGRLLVDGHDLAGVRLMDYREQVASVLQENFLFDGTISDNVGYARPGASRDEIRDACRKPDAGRNRRLTQLRNHPLTRKSRAVAAHFSRSSRQLCGV